MITWVVTSSILSALVAGGGSYLISRKLSLASSKIQLEQANARAKAIEYEAERFLQESKIKAKDIELEAKLNADRESSKILKEHEANLLLFEKEKLAQSQNMEREICKIEHEKHLLHKDRNALFKEQESLKKLKNTYNAKLEELTQSLSKVANLTKNEAKQMFLERIKEESKLEASKIIREQETQAKEIAKEKANYILAMATSRFAGEFAAERLIQSIVLPSDDLKARIIGKEGRNIKCLEMICGVDIIIDDTPNVIIVSSHNLYRRAIAVETINRLVEDGRIQPARIEEIYQKCFDEFEENIYKEGEHVTLDLGLSGIHPEIKKLIGKLRYRASYGQNALAHSLEVANLAGIIAAELGGDCMLATRAGLLHDIGKSRTHEFKGTHVELGAEIARRYNEPPVVLNAILSHHGNEEIKSIEAAAVCAADALSAARPGARREVLENYLRRVSEIEKIATSKMGVLHAYAINSGREVRVIVKSEDIDDDEAYVLAKEIAKDIESNVQYPGEVKVSVIRETRACAVAE
ncbi:ribonuclease Y [Helicobacter sp. MIT 11-5569]|uniref:ribonuclease Y n=1 Tax=Helicobacter sp. MIT 11-5569 TaxID=1548151 RepID=UPI00051F995D|nr:ribonuclease Y [Helicobacter sp. MIT 11-5569]TLD82673.1 ribonuclease Y [Helicobacter sp. MIT 11-5569]